MQRAIVILLVPLLLASLLSVAMIRGDLSGDGRIDLADAILSVQSLANSVEEAAGTSVVTSLSEAIAAFKTVAGLTTQISDTGKNSRTSPSTYLVLGISPHSRISFYELVAFIKSPENTRLASTYLDRPTPPPEFA